MFQSHFQCRSEIRITPKDLGQHPDDEDDVEEHGGASVETLSELGSQAGSMASVVTPQTRGDKKLLRLSLQHSTWSSHSSSSQTSSCSKSTRSAKELDDLAAELKKAMLKTSETPEKIEKPPRKESSGLPVHASWLSRFRSNILLYRP
jgi:hypothetical protein